MDTLAHDHAAWLSERAHCDNFLPLPRATVVSLSMYEQVTVGRGFGLEELPLQRKTSVVVEFEIPIEFMTLV